MEQQLQQLSDNLAAVLKANDRTTHTIPASNLYPHQWLWDSCFIAIGLRHIDIERAVTEIDSLLEGQWANGMVPHMIFTPGREYRREHEIWKSWLSPYAPSKLATSGITQPPMLAEAIYRVGKKLNKAERKRYYARLLPALIRHHEWLYDERDPHNEGLVLQIHPYETGLDNTPPWTSQLREHHRPWWIGSIKLLHLEPVINFFRRDTRHVPPGQRMPNIEALLYWDVIRRLRRKNYNIGKILHRSLFCIEDITFNSIFVRANILLRDMAKEARVTVPEALIARMKVTEAALETCWHEPSSQYYSRDFITHDLITEPTIGTFMPLYAGTISKERAARLVALLTDYKRYWLNHPVPSVPLNSSYFDPVAYWQGPTWINTNWLIIDGLRRYGFNKEADELTEKTILLVGTQGPFEYFSPTDGDGLGASNFSWSAALTLDLLSRPRKT